MSNPVTRWQIISKDPDSHSAFYRDVFGWEISATNAMSYRQASSRKDQEPDGGFWPSPPDGPSFVQLFIRVEDVEESIARAVTHGAEVVVAPQKLPDGEVMAILRDCEGLPFGLYSAVE